MQEIEIREFGPIRNCAFQVKPFNVLIGPQASGKSTISKLIFFFLHLKDFITEIMLDFVDNDYSRFEMNVVNPRLKDRFVEFFGPTPKSENLYIKYLYSPENYLEITDYEYGPSVSFRFSPVIISRFYSLYHELQQIKATKTQPQPSMFPTLEAERTGDLLVKKTRSECESIFGITKQLLYIPAGRSSFPIFSDQLDNINTERLDYPMKKFINKINSAKGIFNTPIDKMIDSCGSSNNQNGNKELLKRALSWLQSILKGRYHYDRSDGEERLYIGENLYLKINLASSGQQEVLWILLSLFMVVYEKVDAMIFIEEPEAHLFPDAQKELVELISFIHSSMKSDFFVTTHSPYILTSLNNLIYAYNVGQNSSVRTEAIIKRDIWLPPQDTSGYFLSDGAIEDLFSNELNMFKAELIDNVSEKTEEEYNKLFDIENETVEI